MTALEFNNILKKYNLSIAAAESITGGLFCATITSVSGASEVVKCGIVTYQARCKTLLLGVDSSIIEQYSSESIETTISMVRGLSQVGIGASIYIAVTGVASAPSTDYKIIKPIGQIYIAVIYKNQLHLLDTIVEGNNRIEIQQKTVQYMMEFVVKTISEN
ncbi:MAG: CinA family protein [Bacteroidota bacterium]|nr:CinA family protein [Bacteroidota bacterium]